MNTVAIANNDASSNAMQFNWLGNKTSYSD